MIAIDGIKVTKRMREAGEQFASDAIDCYCAALGGVDVGGKLSIDWNRFKNNSDLLRKYLDDEISSVEGIYISMVRAKELSDG